MIRWLILALLSLFVGTLLAVLTLKDNGYILIGYDVWTIEGSLALFLLLDALLFAALYFTIRFMIRLWQVPSRVQNWNQQRTVRLAREALTRGLLEMAEGEWKSAEKRLVRHAQGAETPLLNYLAAARAAQLQGAHDRRDSYLQLAHESMPSADIAVSLTQAELQLAHHQLEQALATLKHLKGIAPKHVYVLKLLRELYIQLDDWQQLKELLPDLKRRKVGTPEELRALEIRVHHYSLDQAAASTGSLELELAWKQVPRHMRHETALILSYVRHLASLNETDKAVKVLANSLNHEWQDELVNTFGLIEASDAGRQLSVAENWLKKQPDNPVLLLALGRLSLKAKLWGKARSYLESSTAIQANPDALLELGNLLQQMGEESAALECFSKGLRKGIKTEPIALPEKLSGNSLASAPVAHSTEPPTPVESVPSSELKIASPGA